MLLILAIVLARGFFRLRMLTVRVALLNVLLLGLLSAQPREESECVVHLLSLRCCRSAS